MDPDNLFEKELVLLIINLVDLVRVKQPGGKVRLFLRSPFGCLGGDYSEEGHKKVHSLMWSMEC